MAEVIIRPSKNGPYIVEGPVELFDTEGKFIGFTYNNGIDSMNFHSVWLGQFPGTISAYDNFEIVLLF